MRYLVVFLVCFLIAGFAFADDPGVRDSLIIETVYAELGDSSVDIRIFVTSDDSIAWYNFPLAWSLIGDSVIYPIDVSPHNIIDEWDIFECDILYDQGFIRMMGWDSGGDTPSLITNNYRMLCWTVHFAIDSLAEPQIVTVDTTCDPINGSLLFFLVNGVISFIPVFTPGAIYYGITSDARDNGRILPEGLTLLQNYPNPFNATTTIEFTLPEEAVVELSIYDILGQKVAVIFDEIKRAGVHRVTWDAEEYPSGVYFARLETGDISKSVKMVLLK
ncbi:MAG: T9SS type A sorting domain-containing protein [Candidatus Zixiibacteriota bacterium]|nr:MAG: T9SS type A sorting domain-containing protein [candidate division Zixibacteria bacterium]